MLFDDRAIDADGFLADFRADRLNPDLQSDRFCHNRDLHCLSRCVSRFSCEYLVIISQNPYLCLSSNLCRPAMKRKAPQAVSSEQTAKCAKIDDTPSGGVQLGS